MSSHNPTPLIRPGKRAVIAARTGSGKTVLAAHLASAAPVHWVVINPKWTAGYKDLKSSRTIEGINYSEIEDSIESHKFTIVNPLKHECKADIMDDLISYLHEEYSNIGIICDELLSLHRNGIAGDGLTGWLTRGRELGQSFIGLTQRPKRISMFVFSEADYIGAMDLTLKGDRERMREVTGDDRFLNFRTRAHRWLWYDVGRDNLRLFGAVPIAK